MEDGDLDEAEGPPDPGAAERGFRKLYWTFGLRILAGAVVFAALFFIHLPSKWLALPFILIGGYLVLVNLSSLAIVSRAHHAFRKGSEDDTPLAYQERGE